MSDSLLHVNSRGLAAPKRRETAYHAEATRRRATLVALPLRHNPLAGTGHNEFVLLKNLGRRKGTRKS